MVRKTYLASALTSKDKKSITSIKSMLPSPCRFRRNLSIYKKVLYFSLKMKCERKKKSKKVKKYCNKIFHLKSPQEKINKLLAKTSF